MSQHLVDIISLSLSRAIVMGRMFTPSVLVLENEKRVNYVFDFGTSDYCIEKARKFARRLSVNSNAIAYAIAYDGLIHLSDKKVDVMITEAGERGKKKGVIFIQPYTNNNILFIKRIKPIGDAIFNKETINYLK